MIENCGHPDAWFCVHVLEEGRQRICCINCVHEEVQELPLGWTASIERVGE